MNYGTPTYTTGGFTLGLQGISPHHAGSPGVEHPGKGRRRVAHRPRVRQVGTDLLGPAEDRRPRARRCLLTLAAGVRPQETVLRRPTTFAVGGGDLRAKRDGGLADVMRKLRAARMTIRECPGGAFAHSRGPRGPCGAGVERRRRARTVVGWATRVERRSLTGGSSVATGAGTGGVGQPMKSAKWAITTARSQMRRRPSRRGAGKPGQRRWRR